MFEDFVSLIYTIQQIGSYIPTILIMKVISKHAKGVLILFICLYWCQKQKMSVQKYVFANVICVGRCKFVILVHCNPIITQSVYMD